MVHSELDSLVALLGAFDVDSLISTVVLVVSNDLEEFAVSEVKEVEFCLFGNWTSCHLFLQYTLYPVSTD